MGHTVLVLTGSLRAGGNSDGLADALIRGIEGAGNRAIRYPAAQHPHRPCLACDQCFRDGQACPRDEAFSALAPQLEECAGLSFVTPLYWLGFPGGLKLALDKLYAFRVGKRSLAGKRCALLACGEGDRPGLFDPLRLVYEDMVAYEGWTDVGTLFVPGMRTRGQLRDPAVLARAQALGAQL